MKKDRYMVIMGIFILLIMISLLLIILGYSGIIHSNREVSVTLQNQEILYMVKEKMGFAYYFILWLIFGIGVIGETATIVYGIKYNYI